MAFTDQFETPSLTSEQIGDMAFDTMARGEAGMENPLNAAQNDVILGTGQGQGQQR